MKFLPPAIFCLVFFSCNPQNPDATNDQVEGYAPVYLSLEDAAAVTFEPAKNTEFPGKIYASGTTLFQNDVNKGIHIINASNPREPKKTGFLKVALSTELAVKGNYLYTNNLSDLVVFDISNINSPKMVKRIANAFPPVSQQYPPVSNVVFECADASKGVVVRWEKKLLTGAKCRR